MDNKTEIYKSILELSWRFGNHGFNGECCGDLSLVEFMALKSVLEHNETTIQEIGNAINFTKSGASKIIDRLENKGYAVRMTSPVDGRVCCVLATEKGKKTVTGIIENYTLYLDNVFKGIDPQEVDHIKEALKTLVDAIQKNQPFNSITNME
jgi:DNA-binding MarR family transcriptional regulator